MAAPKQEQAAARDAQEEWDTIVIGSGIGGLTAASLLSQCQTNRRVLVLEQNIHHAGGCCQEFERNGYPFAVGLHYVGDMSNTGQSKKLMDALAPESDPIQWSKLPDAFDTVMIGNEEFRRYDNVAHRQEEALIEQFPNEKDAITEFFRMMKRAALSATRSFVLKCLPRPLMWFLVHTGLYRCVDKGFHKYAKMTVQQVTDSLTQDQNLRTVLGYIAGDYGMRCSKAPFVLHALVFLGFLKGAYYPTNGPGVIPGKITKAIEACGGEVRINATVKEILVTGGRAKGVELVDGTRIHAKQVISDAGYINTFQKLVPKANQPACLVPAASPGLENGVTGIALFVGLNGDFDDDFHLPHQQLWVYPDNRSGGVAYPDTLKGLEAMKAEDIRMFITVPCAKDQAWKTSHPGKTTLEILTEMPWTAFNELVDESGQLRPDKAEEYDRFKRTFGQVVWTRSRQVLLAAGASENLPTSLNDADVSEMGTPLTFMHFLGRSAWLGLDHGVERFRPQQWYLNLRPECKIEGLFLTGQDVSTSGIEGALIGGYICAAKVLGEKKPFDLTQKVNDNRVK